MRVPSWSSRTGAVVLAAATAALVAGCGAEEEPAAETAGTRVVQHARGETEVPADPQRVVVLEPVQLDTAIALGAVPVGSAVLGAGDGIPAYLGDVAAGISTVGTFQEPDLEAIAALQPDLILGTETRQSALYEQLSGIAPTVFMAAQTDPWRDNVAFTAEALGDPDGADDLLRAYDDRCAEIAAEFDTGGMTAQMIRPRDDVLSLYSPDSFGGGTLECTGLTIPDREYEDAISADVSFENAADAAADLVVVTSAEPDDPATMPEVITLNAEAFPDPHLVDQAYWILGVGPLGGMEVLDDVERLLATG